MLKQFFILCFFTSLLQVIVYGQASSNKNSFNHIITTIKGDLNNDKLPDSVIVLQDTLNNKAPYRLQIFFKHPDAGYHLVIQNDSAIEAEFPDGKESMLPGSRFSYIHIKAGVITMNTELLRGYYEYKFRYQNGYFALIGFKQDHSDGDGNATTTEFNLSTGIQLEKIERYDTGKIISSTKKKIKINPLQNLKGFIPFSTTLY
jgi:hypothetical protein